MVKAMNPQDCLKLFIVHVVNGLQLLKAIDLVSNLTVILMLAWPKLTRGILLL